MNTEQILTLAGVIFASSGMWKLIETIWTTKYHKQTAEEKLLLGLAFNRIIKIATKHIEKGWIDIDEYHELNKYLFKPYKEAGGNGTAQKMINEVEKLPMRKGGI